MLAHPLCGCAVMNVEETYETDFFEMVECDGSACRECGVGAGNK